MLARLAVACGLLAPIVFIATDLVAQAQWRGYSAVTRSISELSAVGAPTRSFTLPLFALHSLLLLAFAGGAFALAGDNLALRVAAGLVAVSGAASLVSSLLFPQQLGAAPAFLTPAVLLGATSVIALLVAILLGVVAIGGWFRIYSIATLVAFALLTVAGFLQAAPRIGVQERVMAYASLLWVLLLAIALLAAHPAAHAGERSLA